MGKSSDYTSGEPYVSDLDGVNDLTEPTDSRRDTRQGKEGARGGGLWNSRRIHTGYIGYGKQDRFKQFMDVVEGRKKSHGSVEISDAAKREILRCKAELEEGGEVTEATLRNMVLYGLLDQAESARPQVRGRALQLLGETIGQFKKVSVSVGDRRALDELRRIEGLLKKATPRTLSMESQTQDVVDFESLPPQK